MDADYKAHYFRRNEKSRYGFAWSTRIQDVVNFGQPSEHKLPPGTGSGFIWRLFSISRFEERDGGVYVELEAMALSRCVPAWLGWLVNPVISRLSQSSLVTSLSRTREAVRSLPQRAGLDSCGLALSSPGRTAFRIMEVREVSEMNEHSMQTDHSATTKSTGGNTASHGHETHPARRALSGDVPG